MRYRRPRDSEALNAQVPGLQSALRPGSSDGKRDAWGLNVGEQPFAIRAVRRARPLRAPEVADEPVSFAVQHHVVARELEDLAVDRETVEELLSAAVFAEDEAAARADGDVVGGVEYCRAR